LGDLNCTNNIENDDGGSGNNFRIVNPNITPGEYNIAVRSQNSATGSYTLNIEFEDEFEQNDTILAASNLGDGYFYDTEDYGDSGMDLKAYISPTGDNDWFKAFVQDTINDPNQTIQVKINNLNTGDRNYDLRVYFVCEEGFNRTEIFCWNGSYIEYGTSYKGCNGENWGTSEYVNLEYNCKYAVEDSGNVRIHVYPRGTPVGKEPYHLYYGF
jgi:hypothetical protein